jgi:uncharacterized protein YutE (UPF0331/DUF86 family)
MVDKALVAGKIASVRDAVSRIREVLPADPEAFLTNRTAREITVLNLFVALQDCLSLATHWLADKGLDVPDTYADVFRSLGERGAVSPDVAARLAAASGFRNLIAHQYGVLDWSRVYTIAAGRLDDLLEFCDQLARVSAD